MFTAFALIIAGGIAYYGYKVAAAQDNALINFQTDRYSAQLNADRTLMSQRSIIIANQADKAIGPGILTGILRVVSFIPGAGAITAPINAAIRGLSRV
jgi:hypothetical protein